MKGSQLYLHDRAETPSGPGLVVRLGAEKVTVRDDDSQQNWQWRWDQVRKLDR